MHPADRQDEGTIRSAAITGPTRQRYCRAMLANVAGSPPPMLAAATGQTSDRHRVLHMHAVHPRQR
ncbi:hypothetical protein AB870_04525 [Pandoraea faecigallinarum]|nr:hypothetical protein AB870_04525 [Pandoraea faecigallinarum]